MIPENERGTLYLVTGRLHAGLHFLSYWDDEISTQLDFGQRLSRCKVLIARDELHEWGREADWTADSRMS